MSKPAFHLDSIRSDTVKLYPRPWHISHKREHLVDSKYERSDRIPIMDAYGVKICDVENKGLAEFICNAINGVRLPLANTKPPEPIRTEGFATVDVRHEF